MLQKNIGDPIPASGNATGNGIATGNIVLSDEKIFSSSFNELEVLNMLKNEIEDIKKRIELL